MGTSAAYWIRNRILGPSRRARSRCAASVALMLLLPGTPALPAQEPGDSPGTQEAPSAALFGKVLDHRSGEPIHRAAVYLPGREIGFLTDSTGAFHLPDIPLGEHTVTVERLGYHPVEVRVTLGERPAPFHFRLVPDPVLLEGLEVVLDRLESRRRSVATSVRVIREQDLRTSATADMIMFLSGRGMVQLRPCPGQGLQNYCVLSRGRVRPVTVYIDEWRAMGGLDELGTWDPQAFHTIEIYAQGRQIRTYTHHFMERAARTRLLPIPLFF